MSFTSSSSELSTQSPTDIVSDTASTASSASSIVFARPLSTTSSLKGLQPSNSQPISVISDFPTAPALGDIDGVECSGPVGILKPSIVANATAQDHLLAQKKSISGLSCISCAETISTDETALVTHPLRRVTARSDALLDADRDEKAGKKKQWPKVGESLRKKVSLIFPQKKAASGILERPKLVTAVSAPANTGIVASLGKPHSLHLHRRTTSLFRTRSARRASISGGKDAKGPAQPTISITAKDRMLVSTAFHLPSSINGRAERAQRVRRSRSFSGYTATFDENQAPLVDQNTAGLTKEPVMLHRVKSKQYWSWAEITDVDQIVDNLEFSHDENTIGRAI